MSVLLGIGGPIGSGKTTLAQFFGQLVENHTYYETNSPIIEIANRFNQLLEAELNFETTHDSTELVNQALIWMPDIIAEHLHRNTTWSHIALTTKDIRAHPELYDKLFMYLAAVHADHSMVEKTITIDNKKTYRALLQWLGGYFVAKISPTIWYDELFRRIDLHESFRDLIVIGGVRYLSDAAAIREHGGIVIMLERPTATQDTDVTESQRSSIRPDIRIINSGTIEQLQLLTEQIWNDIAAGKPKQSYSTT